MAVNTTSSIGVWKGGPPCFLCGHKSGLQTKDHQGRPVCFDACPEGPPPEDPPSLFAHDPLGDVKHDNMGRVLPDHADLRALERLRALGHGLTKEKAKSALPAEVHETIGDVAPEKLVLRTEVLRAALDREGLAEVAGGPVLSPSIGETRYGGVGRQEPPS